MLTTKSLAVIVACYRDGETIETMLKRLHAVMKDVTPNYQIVYVNDASPDNAQAVLEKAFSQDKHLKVIEHARNFGSQNVFTSGMANTTTDAVILMDGDLQDPPELIPEFVKKWLEGYHVVYGVRTRRKTTFLMGLFYKMFYRIYQKLSYVDVPLDAGDFSIIDRRVANILVEMPERDRFLRGLRAWVGFKQTGIEYTRAERFSGESTNSFWDNIRWAKRGIFSLSFKPLEWISYLAGIMVLLSALAMIVYVYFYFAIGAPPGFVTLLLVTLFLGGLQLLCLSVMAEYIGRIFDEVKGRPKYIVHKILDHER